MGNKSKFFLISGDQTQPTCYRTDKNNRHTLVTHYGIDKNNRQTYIPKFKHDIQDCY